MSLVSSKSQTRSSSLFKLYSSSSKSASSPIETEVSSFQEKAKDALISSLQQEIECLKREKLFLQSKQSAKDTTSNVDLERQRADMAERAYG